MALPREPSVVILEQLAGLFTVLVTVILLATMGMVNGLRFRWVFLGAGTVRGVAAQIVGGLCILVELAGVGLLIGYIALLRSYCGANAGCFLSAPITSLLAAWPLIFWIAMVVFCFVRWVLLRHEELVVLTDAFSFVVPSVHHYVNGILSLSHERRMSRLEVGQIMEFVRQHAPAVIRDEPQQVMDGDQLDPEKLAAALLAIAPFRDQGDRVEIALIAVVEAYIDSDKSPVPPRRDPL